MFCVDSRVQERVLVLVSTDIVIHVACCYDVLFYAALVPNPSTCFYAKVQKLVQLLPHSTSGFKMVPP